eukprot:7389333-Prymnesium_polylepis.1
MRAPIPPMQRGVASGLVRRGRAIMQSQRRHKRFAPCFLVHGMTLFMRWRNSMRYDLCCMCACTTCSHRMPPLHPRPALNAWR